MTNAPARRIALAAAAGFIASAAIVPLTAGAATAATASTRATATQVHLQIKNDSSNPVTVSTQSQAVTLGAGQDALFRAPNIKGADMSVQVGAGPKERAALSFGLDAADNGDTVTLTGPMVERDPQPREQYTVEKGMDYTSPFMNPGGWHIAQLTNRGVTGNVAQITLDFNSLS